MVPVWRIGAEAAGSADSPSSVVELAAPNAADKGLNLAAALTLLSDQGITRLLVEAGPRLSTALLGDDLVDQLAWYRGPTVMGGDGHAVFSSLNVEKLAEMKSFAPSATIPLGADNLTIYTRRLEA